MERVIAVIGALLMSLLAGGPTHAETQLRANQQAARQDARQLLQSLSLPTGVSSITTEPGFARVFAGTGSPSGKSDAGDQALWTTSANPRSIIAYVAAHPPAGSLLDVGSGSGSDAKTGVTSVDIQFSWPDVTQKLLNRMLTITVVSPPHGSSVIVADSQSQWFVPRSWSERVPRGVHAVEITLTLPTGPTQPVETHTHTSTHVITRAAKVRSLVKELNSLPIVQSEPLPMSCPVMLAGSQASELTLAFKTSPTGATLARAQVSARRGHNWDDGAGACNPVDFWVAGRQQTPLTSPTLVSRIGELIGANIS
jgi:hypothetical protein